MGNESSKSTIENQQLIMQLQQQLLQQHNNQQPQPQPQQQPQPQPQPQPSINHLISNGHKILEILGNKELMKEIDKKPNAKRKLLEKLLNEHRHMMTSNQVMRITQILDSLPPVDYDKAQIQQKAYAKQIAQMHSSNSINQYTNHGTTARDVVSRQLQTTKQLNTIDALTKHYKTEGEEEEARFKIEEDKRREDFLEKQRQRRMHYQTSLSDLDKSNIDALRLFQLQKTYTIEELKNAYKKLAMKTHPDKEGGNVEQFQLVTKCYMSLLEKYKNRESDLSFNDLRNNSKTYNDKQEKFGNANSINNMNSKFYNKDEGQQKQDGKQKQIQSKDNICIQKDNFNAKLFNKIYEENKLWESGDDGYGDWFNSTETEDAPSEVFSSKFNINIFNTTFSDYKDKITSQSGAIQEYKDPQELISCSTGFTDIDLYARKINDFSKPLPIGNGCKSDLAYTDLKTAYSSKGAFIDPSKVEFKEYKNVDELKRDRSNIKYDMTPAQMTFYENKKRIEEEEEFKRQELIRQRDTIITNSFGKTHERMLGYKSI